MDFLSIIPSMLMPGIIGTSTENAIASVPTSRLVRYWAALGLQKNKGAKSSQMPMKAVAHCPNQAVRFESDIAPKIINTIPLSISLRARALARHSIDGKPRSRVTATTDARAVSADTTS